MHGLSSKVLYPGETVKKNIHTSDLSDVASTNNKYITYIVGEDRAGTSSSEEEDVSGEDNVSGGDKHEFEIFIGTDVGSRGGI